MDVLELTGLRENTRDPVFRNRGWIIHFSAGRKRIEENCNPFQK